MVLNNNSGRYLVILRIFCREYNVYSIDNKAKIIGGLNTPMIMDTSGLWLRRNGLDQNLLLGHTPLLTEETKSLSEQEYNQKVIIPSLINRIPSLENTEVSDDEAVEWIAFKFT